MNTFTKAPLPEAMRTRGVGALTAVVEELTGGSLDEELTGGLLVVLRESDTTTCALPLRFALVLLVWITTPGMLRSVERSV